MGSARGCTQERLSPSEPGQWTVVGILGGGGQGRGLPLLPKQTRHDATTQTPNRQTGGVFMEDADEATFGHRRNR